MDTFRQGSPLATWPWRLGLGDLALATWPWRLGILQEKPRLLKEAG